MTKEQIEAIERLESKATAEPWWAQREYDGGRTVCQMRHQTETVCVNKASHVEGNPWDAHWDNANLVEALRNNAKPLLAAARRAMEMQEAAMSLARILERIFDDIPARRDWLDPDLERVARQVIQNARRGM